MECPHHTVLLVQGPALGAVIVQQMHTSLIITPCCPSDCCPACSLLMLIAIVACVVAVVCVTGASSYHILMHK